MNKKKRILCWSDSAIAGTGFGVVSKHILTALHNTGKYDIHHLAINFHGDFVDRDKVPWQQQPARLLDPKDPHGIKMFQRTLMKGDYDIIWVCNDLYVTHQVAEVIIKIRQRATLKGSKQPIFIYYYPVDCHVPGDGSDYLKVVDIPVCYTTHGKIETLKTIPEIGYKLKQIPHGVDTSIFKPLPLPQVNAIKKNVLGIDPDTTVVINFNRNSARKQMQYAMLAFKEFRKHVPKSIMYMHTVTKDQGGDLIRAVEDLGMSTKTDIVFPAHYSPTNPAPSHILNQLYNMGDIFLTTHLGEGWGLSLDPFTFINTINGVKYIKDINIGDKVLSSNGEYEEVLDTTSREENITYTLKSKYSTGLITSDLHPYLVSKDRGKTLAWLNIKNLSKGDYIAICKPKNVHDKLPLQIDLTDYIECEYDKDYVWCKMGYSPQRGGLSISKVQREFNVSKRVAEDALNHFRGKKTLSRCLPGSEVHDIYRNLVAKYDPECVSQVKMNRYIPISDTFLEFIGWYLAEGSSENGVRIELSLHKNEKHIAEKFRSWCNDILGIDSIIEEFDNKSRLRISSSILATFLQQECGKGSYNKRIPSWLLETPTKLGPLVKGLFLGDGSIAKSGYLSLTTVSPSLAYQLRDICAANNILVGISEAKIRHGNYIPFILSFKHRERFGKLINLEFKKEVKEIDCIELDKYFLVPIEIITRSEDNTNLLYDICVDNSHSFIANGIVAHNTVTEAMAAGVPVVAPDNTCYKPGTEVFLQDRIDVIENVKVGDKVLSINPKTGNCSFKPVTHEYELDYEGDLIIMDTKQVKLAVTPDHRILHSNGRFSDDIIESKAGEMEASTYRIPCYGDMCNWDYDLWFTLPEPQFKQIHNKSQTHEKFDMSDFLSLLGWYITEGCCEKLGYRIRITQSIKENRDEIFALLDRMQIRYTTSDDNICFNHNQLHQVFSELGSSAQTKTLPRWVFSLHREQLIYLFDNMIKGDGHSCDTYTGFITSSKKLVRDFAELC